MISFENATYLAQVRRLRNLAELALREFPVRAKAIEYIHHGENTTFKIAASGGKNYLLRVHRADYHTLPGIEEELTWLEFLNDKLDVALPKPLRTKTGKRLALVQAPGVSQPRPMTMFEWVDGRFASSALKPQRLRALGRLIGEMQKVSRNRKVRHRRYWVPELMMGAEPKWGSFDRLPNVTSAAQKRLTRTRLEFLRKLKSFAKKHPDRMGLIHSDMHFGNVLQTPGGWGVIDFDDCGWGFHAYDLNAPLMSVHFMLKDKKRLGEFAKFRDELVKGYSDVMSWDSDDDRLLDDLMTVRYLIVLGWLHSRSDNPRLRGRLDGAVKRTLEHLDSL